MVKRRGESRLIVPLFIPNEGCPYRCIYCNQEKVTERAAPLSRDAIREIIETSMQSDKYRNSDIREIAFFGGTFTNLSEQRMIYYLDSVVPYLRDGLFHWIRVSTRPDTITPNRLEIMKKYGVRVVEIGAQSMDDNVLRLSRRGHTLRHITHAVEMLKEYGFYAGIQLMPGLPGDSREIFLDGIKRVIQLKPYCVRLYPAVILKGTVLDRWFREGKYTPLTVAEAVDMCSSACIMLESCGIQVIRIGLFNSPSLVKEAEVVGGPWHQAFGHLVRARIYHSRIHPFLSKIKKGSRIIIRVKREDEPLLRGYRNQGIRELEEKMGLRIASIIPDEELDYGEIRVERAG